MMNYLWKELVLILSYSKSKPNYTFSGMPGVLNYKGVEKDGH